MNKSKYIEKLMDRILLAKTYVMIPKEELKENNVTINDIGKELSFNGFSFKYKETKEYYKIGEKSEFNYKTVKHGDRKDVSRGA